MGHETKKNNHVNGFRVGNGYLRDFEPKKWEKVIDRQPHNKMLNFIQKIPVYIFYMSSIYILIYAL